MPLLYVAGRIDPLVNIQKEHKSQNEYSYLATNERIKTHFNSVVPAS